MSKKPHSKRKESNQQQYDVSILIIFIGYLLIDFLPYFDAAIIIAPQFLYLNILNIIVGLYIYMNPTIFLGSIRSIIHKRYFVHLYLIFLVLCGLSFFAANNNSLSILSISQLLVVLVMVVNFAILLYGRLYMISRLALLVGASAFFQAGQALIHLPSFSDPSLIAEFLGGEYLQGNTGNINIFSASLLTKLPFVLFGIYLNHDWKKWFLMVALLMLIMCVLLVNARASLLTLIIIVLTFFVHYLSNNPLQDKITYRRALFVIAPLLIAIFSANILMSHVESSRRFSSTAERLQQINLDESSARARLEAWKNSWYMAQENPVLGIGLGNWRIESIPMEVGETSLTANAHNDFFELLAETGFLNGFIYLSLFFYLLVVNLNRVRRKDEPTRQIIAMVTLMLLIAYGIDAFFNFPLYRPTMQLAFAFLLVFTLINSTDVERQKALFKHNKPMLLGLFAIGFVTMYVNYFSYKTSTFEKQIWAVNTESVASDFIGNMTGDKVMEKEPKFPDILRKDMAPFAEYAGIFYYREGKYEQAIRAFDISNAINPYMNRSDFYKAVIAQQKGMQDSAYFYMKSSFYKRTSKMKTDHFSVALSMAASFQDTTEMLKMYNFYNEIHHNPEAAYKTGQGLRQAGYSYDNLVRFVSNEKEKFRADTLAQQNLNNVLVVHHINEGQNYYTASQPDLALKSYQRALDIDTDNALALQSMGMYYYNVGKLNEAIPYLIRSLEKPGVPNQGQSELILGLCYLRLQNIPRGCHFFNIAKTNNPRAAELYNQICR